MSVSSNDKTYLYAESNYDHSFNEGRLIILILESKI